MNKKTNAEANTRAHVRGAHHFSQAQRAELVRASARLTGGLLLLGCVSCGAEMNGDVDEAASSDETGETAAAIVKGTATNLRPAIGKLVKPGGGFCSATLVDAKHIITADHCFGSVTGPQNDTFEMYDTNGKLLATRGVNRSYSLGYGVGNLDVAIGRLSTSVAADLVTPETIRDTRPSAGGTATIVGYGCTKREDLSGAGTKRYHTYNYGTPTTAICEGDSGGPHVSGGIANQGGIFAITSGSAGLNTDPKAVDFQGDAALYGNSMLLAVKTFGNTVYKNEQRADFALLAAMPNVVAVGGDFDGDSRSDDIALVGGNWQTIPLALGDGTGKYTMKNESVVNFPSWARLARSVVAGDFDEDGDTDIALIGATADTIPVAFSNRNGTFTVKNKVVAGIPVAIKDAGAYAVAGDFDGDEKDDIALLGGKGWSTVPMARSLGDGNFTYWNEVVPDLPWLSQNTGAKSAVGDFDADGKEDIVLAGPSGWTTVPVARSIGGGKFTTQNRSNPRLAAWAAAPGARLLAGDFDGDDDADIAVIGWTGSTTIGFGFSDRAAAFTRALLPVAEFPGWASVAPFIIAGRLDGNKTSDLITLGSPHWNTIPTAFLKP